MRETTRRLVFERDDYTCQYCGYRRRLDGMSLHVDHVFPKSRGGSNRVDNLLTACSRCNLQKHDRIIDDHHIPVAWCARCGLKDHPAGTAWLCEIGVIWLCPPCDEDYRVWSAEYDRRMSTA